MEIDKSAVLVAVLAQVDAQLESLRALQRDAQAGATHEENRPENDKDTRATEASYLARGLAKRVGELREAQTKLSTLALRSFADDAPIALTALVTIADEERERTYFIAPAGGGLKAMVTSVEVHVITPSAPLARLLIGKRIDDEVEQTTAQGVRELTIAAVR